MKKICVPKRKPPFRNAGPHVAVRTYLTVPWYVQWSHQERQPPIVAAALITRGMAKNRARGIINSENTLLLHAQPYFGACRQLNSDSKWDDAVFAALSVKSENSIVSALDAAYLNTTKLVV